MLIVTYVQASLLSYSTTYRAESIEFTPCGVLLHRAVCIDDGGDPPLNAEAEPVGILLPAPAAATFITYRTEK